MNTPVQYQDITQLRESAQILYDFLCKAYGLPVGSCNAQKVRELIFIAHKGNNFAKTQMRGSGNSRHFWVNAVYWLERIKKDVCKNIDVS